MDAPRDRSGGIRRSIVRNLRGKNPKLQPLAWNSTQPRLVITSNTPDFDTEIISQFQEEGFQVAYLQFTGDPKAFNSQLQRIADPLEEGEHYAIVAYGDAASLVLEACTQVMPKLVAVVAYYPSMMPHESTFTPKILVQIHLASTQQFGTRHKSFRYDDTKSGFAEHDMEEFDHVAAEIAWSRTLSALRKGFIVEVDLEGVCDNFTRTRFGTKEVDDTVDMMAQQAYVNNVPVMTGGSGAKELRRFYTDFFATSMPENGKTKLLSRTVGSDRVADEILFTFRHTCEIPWMLPGIPPTDKLVEVVLVSVVCIRGGKVYHEHLYWDQATVLVQVGLLDPKYIPPSFTTSASEGSGSMSRLPVLGAEAARKVVDENAGASNELIPGWRQPQ